MTHKMIRRSNQFTNETVANYESEECKRVRIRCIIGMCHRYIYIYTRIYLDIKNRKKTYAVIYTTFFLRTV